MFSALLGQGERLQDHWSFGSYFCSKHRLWVHVRTALVSVAVLTSTHNLCFRAKRESYEYSCKPQFYSIKVGCKRV